MTLVQKFVISSLLLGQTLHAQNSSPSDSEAISTLVQQVKALQQETTELRARVQELEQSRASVALSSPADGGTPLEQKPPDQAPSPAESSNSLNALLHEVHGFQWRGFGEVNYKVLDQRQPELGTYGFVAGSAGNFYTGDFDLLLTARINNRASVLSEMAFGEGDAQSFSIDLERVLLKYDLNDHLKMSFGRYHTGIGYFNTAFHSGAWIRNTVDRPLVMEFATDGGLLPTQAVGVSVTGLIPSGKFGLNYIAEYGSSDTIRPDINGSGTLDDENNGNHFNVGLFVRPDFVPGLQIGASYYHDQIGDSSVEQPIRYGQTIVNAHVVYVAHGLEILNEGFLIRHAQLHGPLEFNMPAFYTQFSKRLGRVRPFFRYQYNHMNEADSIYDDVGLRYGPSFGARYDFDDSLSFKAQLDHTSREHLPNLNGLQLQLAFTF